MSPSDMIEDQPVHMDRARAIEATMDEMKSQHEATHQLLQDVLTRLGPAQAQNVQDPLPTRPACRSPTPSIPASSAGRKKLALKPSFPPNFSGDRAAGKAFSTSCQTSLNAMTVKNKYPLPLIPELIAKLRGAKYFTKLDVRWGFNNVWIKEGDEWKAAFRTNRGLFEPLVMFFGLTNSPATFQTMMDDIFEDLISEGVVVVYLDDILIFTETLEEHRKVTRCVLELLEKHKLYLRPDKCEFEKTTVEYLGVIISHNSVSMDPVKIAGVTKWAALVD